MVLLDHKHSLKHLPVTGGLYGEPNMLAGGTSVFSERDTLWDPNQIQVIKNEAEEKPEFQKDLDQNVDPEKFEDKDYKFSETVNTWSDYLSTRLHPRSFHLLRSVNEVTEDTPFDCFAQGAQIWNDEYLEDDFGNHIRQYIEECHSCQGFQTLFDCNNAFSGISAKCFEHLSDEYGKASLAIPIFAPSSKSSAISDSVRVVNTVLAYSSLMENVSLILPLSVMRRAWRNLSLPREFPNFSYNAQNLYESSSVLATYLDTISLRYRLAEPIQSCYLPDFCSDLTNYGRKLAAAGLSMPFAMKGDETLIDCLDAVEGDLFTQLSPNTKIGTDRTVQSISIRGIEDSRLKNTTSKREVERQRKMAAYRCDSVSEMMQLYFQCRNYASLAHVLSTKKGMNTRKPFPIEGFDYRVNSQGFLNTFAMESDARQNVQSIPTMATAQCSNDIFETLDSLLREARRVRVAKIPRFKECGLEADEVVEALEKLDEFKANYEDSFEL